MKIHGVKKVRTSEGLLWYFSAAPPGGMVSLKDFKVLLPDGKAKPLARAKIQFLKELSSHIRDNKIIEESEVQFPQEFPPMLHQLLQIETMLHFPQIAILYQQGLGKSYAALFYLVIQKLLDPESNHKALILAPKVVLPNWCNEVAKFHTGLTIIKYSGSAKQRVALRKQIAQEQPDIVLTNYEALTPKTYDAEATELRAEIAVDKAIAQVTKVVARKEKIRVALQETKAAGRSTNALDKRWISAQAAYDEKQGRVGRRLEELHTIQETKDIAHLADYSFFKDDLCFDSVIMDEASELQGHKSKRSLSVESITNRIPRRYLMSGTISSGSPLDLFMPFKILNTKILGTNFWAYRNSCCTFSPYNKHILIGYKNLDKVKSKIDPYILEATRNECMSLPTRTISSQYYEMSPEQHTLYNDIIAEDTIIVGDREIDVTVPVVKITKLLQVLSGFLTFPLPRHDTKCNTCDKILTCIQEDTYPWDKKHCVLATQEPIVKKPQTERYFLKENPKLDLLKNILSNTTEKVIIWSYYKVDQIMVQNLLQELDLKFITPDVEGSDLIFEKNEAIQIYTGQVSQGIGTTLNSATLMIYYSYPLKLIHYLQSMDRNHRKGQGNKTLLLHLMAEDTLEEGVVRLLEVKENVKDFLQTKINCKKCRKFSWCNPRGIRVYSKKCLHFVIREVVETKTTLQLKTLQE